MPDTLPPLDFADDRTLLNALWARLGSKAFRTQSLATIGLDGSPQVRSIIVRSASPAGHRLTFHTDRTSPKFAELRRDPRAALCAWDADEKLQMRLAATISLHVDDDVAAALWRSQDDRNLWVYRVTRPSGETIDRPEAAGRTMTPDRSRFAAAVATVTAIDWLSLADADQHRRGRFAFDTTGRATHHFIVP